MKPQNTFLALMIFLLAEYFGINYLSKTYQTAIVDFLIYSLPLSLLISFSAILVLSVMNRYTFARKFSKVAKKTWIALLLIFLLGFSLRALTPQTHRIYFDEDIFENIAQNILNSGRAILCNYGTPSGCEEYILNKQPNSYSFLLAITYAVFGVSEAAAFWLNVFIGSVTTFFIFMLAYIIFKNEKIALYSSLVFTLTPLHIIWSATAATEPSMVLFVVLAAISFILYLEIKKISILLLFSFLLIFTLQTRYESLLLVIPLLILFLLYGKPVRNLELHGKKFLLIFPLMLILLTPHLLHLDYANKDSWGSSGEKLSAKYLGFNLSINTAFFLENTRYPAFFTLVAIIGAIYSLINNRKAFVFLGSLFTVFFTVYLFFYAGHYNAGVDAKYSLAVAPPLAVFAGLGFFFLEGKIGKVLPNSYIVIILSILIAFSFFIPYVATIWKESFAAREYHDFALRTAEKLDPNCYIFSHVPSMYIVNGKNSAQLWNLNAPQKMKNLSEKTDCIIYDEGYWCQLPAPYNTVGCQNFHSTYNLTLIDRYAVNGSSLVFSLYYVKNKIT